MTNISEGGMAIFFRGKLPPGSVSTASFKLPGAASPLEPKVQVAWMDDSGRAGLRFIDMPKDSREQLDAMAGGAERNHRQAQPLIRLLPARDSHVHVPNLRLARFRFAHHAGKKNSHQVQALCFRFM